MNFSMKGEVIMSDINLEKVTLDDCYILYEVKNIETVINNGQINIREDD